MFERRPKLPNAAGKSAARTQRRPTWPSWEGSTSGSIDCHDGTADNAYACVGAPTRDAHVAPAPCLRRGAARRGVVSCVCVWVARHSAAPLADPIAWTSETWRPDV